MNPIQVWVSTERTWILNGLLFTKHFIEFVFMETNQLVGSNPNVIYMRDTCGQRSSRAAESKRRALAFHFSGRIRYIFLISESRIFSDSSVTVAQLVRARHFRKIDIRRSLVRFRPKTENLDPHGFEHIDPQARVLNCCFQ